MYQRQKWHQAHASHTYQILARQLGSHKCIVLMTIFYNMLWLLPLAYLSLLYKSFSLIFLVLAVVPILGACIYFKAGKICKK
jgi:Fuc2NAc and GlcNAc transferase